jgi:hypothetical protein
MKHSSLKHFITCIPGPSRKWTANSCVLVTLPGTLHRLSNNEHTLYKTIDAVSFDKVIQYTRNKA